VAFRFPLLERQLLQKREGPHGFPAALSPPTGLKNSDSAGRFQPRVTKSIRGPKPKNYSGHRMGEKENRFVPPVFSKKVPILPTGNYRGQRSLHLIRKGGRRGTGGGEQKNKGKEANSEKNRDPGRFSRPPRIQQSVYSGQGPLSQGFHRGFNRGSWPPNYPRVLSKRGVKKTPGGGPDPIY